MDFTLFNAHHHFKFINDGAFIFYFCNLCLNCTAIEKDWAGIKQSPLQSCSVLVSTLLLPFLLLNAPVVWFSVHLMSRISTSLLITALSSSIPSSSSIRMAKLLTNGVKTGNTNVLYVWVVHIILLC